MLRSAEPFQRKVLIVMTTRKGLELEVNGVIRISGVMLFKFLLHTYL